MATKQFCDICDQEIPEERVYTKVILMLEPVTSRQHSGGRNSTEQHTYDVCATCRGKLHADFDEFVRDRKQKLK